MAEQKRILGKRILLVEDDRGARESIRLLLTIDRHAVVEAPGGEEALELLKNALRLDPKLKALAKTEPDFAIVRDLPEFQTLINGKH